MSIVFSNDTEALVEFVTVQADSTGNFVIPDGLQLFGGDFERSGSDLLIAGEGAETVRIPGYFLTKGPADLHDANGAVLRGDLVELLAGPIAPGQYAQVQADRAASPIGQVETLNGSASVQRVDGTVEALQIGMKIYERDLVETQEGGSISVTFVDGTIFSLASASRMVIDELVYDPNANDNSAGFSLIQGGFVFIAGQVAKTGGMDVGTPASTMGIRGTTGVVQVAAVNGVVTSDITLETDPDGDVGRIELFDVDGNLITSITETGKTWRVSSAERESTEVLRSLAEELEDRALLAEAFAAFRVATSRVEAGDTFVSLSDPSSSQQNLRQNNGVDSDLDVNGDDDLEAIDPLEEIENDVENEANTPLDESNLLDEVEVPTVIAVQGFEDATEDSAIAGQALVQNPGGIPLTFGLGDEPANGTAVVNEDGSFSFVPTPDFNGVDSFTFTANGPDGEVAQGTVVVEVLPVNDAPEANDTLLNTVEDNSVSGVIDVVDVDGDLLSYNLQDLPTDGEVLLLQNGTYSYTPDSDFEGTDSFSVLVTDVEGAGALATVSITVAGENDPPVIVTTVEDASGALVEDAGALSIGGTLEVDDPDAGPAPVWTGDATGAYGDFTISAAGVWQYVLDPDLADTLDDGEEFSEIFSAVVTDNQGISDSIDVVVNLSGTNDLPVLTTVPGDLEKSLTEDVGPIVATGTLTADDKDAGAELTWQTSAIPSMGAFSVTPDGDWTYELDTAAAQQLAEGEVFDELLSVSVSDGIGAPVFQAVTIRITGTNDTPVLTTATGANQGLISEASGILSATGQLDAEDADDGDAVTWSGVSQANYGEFDVGADGAWTYTLDPELAETLQQDQTVQEVFEAVAEDGFGATVTQSIVVTITGENNGPVITTGPGETIGELVEDSGPLVATGKLSATDADNSVAWSGSTTGIYGAFVIDADGAWTYTIDPASVQALAEGQEVTDAFVATVSDGISPALTQTVTVTITGTDDLPVITSSESDAAGALTEDVGDVVASGQLTATDVDGTAIWSGSATGTYGSLVILGTGEWTYTLNTSSVQFLAQDAQVFDTFDVSVTDGVGTPIDQTITITITGTDDLPVIESTGADATGALTEDVGATIAMGKLTATDVDGTPTWSGSATGTYGAFAILGNGEWTYTLDSDAVQFLAQGVEVDDTFEVTVSDGIGDPISQFVTVTITGTNDAPVITSDIADARGELTEGDETIVASGVLTATDADAGQVPVWSGTPQAIYGEFELTSEGSWTYTLDNTLSDGLSVGDTHVERLVAVASDGQGGTTEVTVEVTIIGTNDLPVLKTNTVFETIEGQQIAGTLTATDVDGAVEDLTFSVGDMGPENGTLVINADGSFTYTPDAGFLGVERIEYQVEDADGGISTARLTIEVESDPDNPDNQNVSLGLNIEANETAAAGAIEVGVQSVPVTSVNLAIALDRSGSIGRRGWREMLESVREAVAELAAQFEGSDTVVEVKIITFASDVFVTEKPDGTDYLLSDPELLAIINETDLAYDGGATAWELAFIEAGNFFFSQDPSEANVLLFVTDGQPSSGLYVDPLNELRDPTDAYDVSISAFGFGGAYEEEELLLVDENATFLADASQLSAALQETPIFNPELLSLRVELEADDGEAVLIADQTSDALIVEGTDFELPLASIENILDLLGESNRINITAQFDVNNDPAAAEIELFTTEVIGKADSAQTAVGLDGDDLLFGSDLADTMTGGAGDDILIAFDGSDEIDGGSGRDSIRAGGGDDRIVISDSDTTGDDIDGGAGRDTLAIDAIADINDVLASLELAGVEAIDVTNTQTDDLVLSFEDIFALSDTGDDVLNAYLGATEANSLAFYGDATDTLTLDGGGTYDIEMTGQVTDGSGNTLNVYEFSVGGGNPLATLGVESDIAVTTANVPVG